MFLQSDFTYKAHGNPCGVCAACPRGFNYISDLYVRICTQIGKTDQSLVPEGKAAF